MTHIPKPVVHLELHTKDLDGAAAFLADMFDWRREVIVRGSRSYTALELGGGFGGGGMVECETPTPLWVPYVEVESVAAATRHAQGLGAAVLLEPREGPAGRRSVITSPATGDLALWESKDYPPDESSGNPCVETARS